MEPTPETRYAQAADGGQVAYQVAGSGLTVMLCVNVMLSIDLMWDEPIFARVLARLSSFCRHVWFDTRGAGSSGSLPSGEPRTIASVTDDMVTVVDALGGQPVIVFGWTSPPALLFAATHPAQTKALVLFGPTARFRGDDGYTGVDDLQFEQLIALIGREWGSGVNSRLDGWDEADDRLRRWFAKTERLLYTPREAADQFRSAMDIDLRSVLPTISVPTLVVTRQDASDVSLSQSRYVAEHITGAKYVEVAAGSHLTRYIEVVEEFVTGRLPPVPVNRVLATVMFTDIVDSTARAAAIGDRAWRVRLDEHDAMVRRHLVRFRGREIKTLGDGFLATFDGPARAIRCGCAIRDEARQIGIEVRVGMHTGEIELRSDDIGGVSVNIAFRVAACAGPGEVLVSRTIPDLVAGSGVGFEDGGDHELKGVPGVWRLFAVVQT